MRVLVSLCSVCLVVSWHGPGGPRGEGHRERDARDAQQRPLEHLPQAGGQANAVQRGLTRPVAQSASTITWPGPVVHCMLACSPPGPLGDQILLVDV